MFLCICTMIYVGWERPFTSRRDNNLELMNETLILINSYFMFVYSDFVADSNARYDFGWLNIGLVIIIVVANFGANFISYVYSAYGKLKMKYQKRKQYRLVNQRR